MSIPMDWSLFYRMRVSHYDSDTGEVTGHTIIPDIYESLAEAHNYLKNAPLYSNYDMGSWRLCEADVKERASDTPRSHYFIHNKGAVSLKAYRFAVCEPLWPCKKDISVICMDFRDFLASHIRQTGNMLHWHIFEECEDCSDIWAGCEECAWSGVKSYMEPLKMYSYRESVKADYPNAYEIYVQ